MAPGTQEAVPVNSSVAAQFGTAPVPSSVPTRDTKRYRHDGSQNGPRTCILRQVTLSITGDTGCLAAPQLRARRSHVRVVRPCTPRSRRPASCTFAVFAGADAAIVIETACFPNGYPRFHERYGMNSGPEPDSDSGPDSRSRACPVRASGIPISRGRKSHKQKHRKSRAQLLVTSRSATAMSSLPGNFPFRKSVIWNARFSFNTVRLSIAAWLDIGKAGSRAARRFDKDCVPRSGARRYRRYC